MDLSIYFRPLDLDPEAYANGDLGQYIEWYHHEDEFPEYQDADIAIIGVLEERKSDGNKGCAKAPDAIRDYLYRLKKSESSVKIADLGNIAPGESIDDTYFALAQVIETCIKKRVLPLIIGGSQDLTFANYQAYESLEQVVNIVSIDNSLDLGDVEDEISSSAFLNKIILHQPNYLFNYSNIGYQSYFVSEEEKRLMERLFFDIYRLGEVRADMKEVEPIVRNADMLSFDVSAIRQSDAPGNKLVTPNGFYGEEACMITRYAGLSDKLTSIGFYEINPEVDRQGQTVHLVAQMIWYFFEGFYGRKKDNPSRDSKEFLKYTVACEKGDVDKLIFYKNLKSDRWWMDVPYPASKLSKYQRHQMVPCSYIDYQMACNNEVPDKWWRNYHKLRS